MGVPGETFCQARDPIGLGCDARRKSGELDPTTTGQDPTWGLPEHERRAIVR